MALGINLVTYESGGTVDQVLTPGISYDAGDLIVLFLGKDDDVAPTQFPNAIIQVENSFAGQGQVWLVLQSGDMTSGWTNRQFLWNTDSEESCAAALVFKGLDNATFGSSSTLQGDDTIPGGTISFAYPANESLLFLGFVMDGDSRPYDVRHTFPLVDLQSTTGSGSVGVFFGCDNNISGVANGRCVADAGRTQIPHVFFWSAITPDGQKIVTNDGASNASVKIASLSTPYDITTIGSFTTDSFPNPLSAFSFVDGGNKIATVDSLDIVRIYSLSTAYDVTTKTLIDSRDISGDIGATIRDIEVSPDGKTYVMAADGTVGAILQFSTTNAWDLTNGWAFDIRIYDDRDWRSVSWTHGGKYLVAAEYDSALAEMAVCTITVPTAYDITGGKGIGRWDHDYECSTAGRHCCILPDAKKMYISESFDYLRKVDTDVRTHQITDKVVVDSADEWAAIYPTVEIASTTTAISLVAAPAASSATSTAAIAVSTAGQLVANIVSYSYTPSVVCELWGVYRPLTALVAVQSQTSTVFDIQHINVDLTAPTDGAGVYNDVTFTWDGVVGASHTLLVSQSPDLASPVINEYLPVGTHQFTAGPLAEGHYYWQVEAHEEDAFTLVFNIASNGETLTIPTRDDGDLFSASIDWGDGSQFSTITAWNDPDLSHVYSTAGEYTVKIYGAFPNIYFNNGGHQLKLKAVTNIGKTGLKSLKGAFYGAANLLSVTSTTGDLTGVADASYMLKDATSMTTFDLSNVTGFKPQKTDEMLMNTEALTGTLDMSWMDVSTITDMTRMFADMSNVTGFNFTGWDTSNVTKMYQMFSSCFALTSLDLSMFNVSNVEDMHGMFVSCTSLTSLNITGWNTSKVWRMGSMFSNVGLTSLDLSHFNTSAVTDFGGMFYISGSLTSINMTGWDTSLGQKFNSMFYGCYGLTSLSISHFVTSAATTFNYMFANCTGLTSLDVSGFNTANCKDFTGMFVSCTGVSTIDVSGFDTSSLEECSYMFSSCSSLTSLDVSGFDFSSMIIDLAYRNFGQMMAGLTSLSSLDLSNWTLPVAGQCSFYNFLWNTNCAVNMTGPGWQPSRIAQGGFKPTVDNGALPTASYDALLIDWATKALPTGVAFDFGETKYTGGGAAESARSTIISAGNTINDGGAV